MLPPTDTRDTEAASSSIDEHIGNRIRLRRNLLGLTQEKVAEALGLTFQQIQKYERGANRMGASRLFDLARVLDVPISFFFDDLPTHLGGASMISRHLSGFSLPTDGEGDDSISPKERMDVLRAYAGISDPDIRKRVLELLKSLAG